jgi:hypothetical protein
VSSPPEITSNGLVGQEHRGSVNIGIVSLFPDSKRTGIRSFLAVIIRKSVVFPAPFGPIPLQFHQEAVRKSPLDKDIITKCLAYIIGLYKDIAERGPGGIYISSSFEVFSASRLRSSS